MSARSVIFGSCLSQPPIHLRGALLSCACERINCHCTARKPRRGAALDGIPASFPPKSCFEKGATCFPFRIRAPRPPQNRRYDVRHDQRWATTLIAEKSSRKPVPLRMTLPAFIFEMVRCSGCDLAKTSQHVARRDKPGDDGMAMTALRDRYERRPFWEGENRRDADNSQAFSGQAKHVTMANLAPDAAAWPSSFRSWYRRLSRGCVLL